VSIDVGRAEAALARVSFGPDGLVPAIVQDATSGRLLTLAYMNRESLTKTIESRRTWFWSRSRGELWNKGATSGHVQDVRSLRLDCDGDAILVLVDQTGAACHTGAESCFFDALDPGDDSTGQEIFATLADLERTIAGRAEAADPEASYTAQLLAKGIDTVCKKVGEEATEVAIAAKGAEHDRVVEESADLLFHLAVLWRASGVRLDEVAQVLANRRR
jgi:phosphoribosyl-AMP cyclohydrolase / phosphoribosyl-ATP pyrophosphohydrolase